MKIRRDTLFFRFGKFFVYFLREKLRDGQKQQKTSENAFQNFAVYRLRDKTSDQRQNRCRNDYPPDALGFHSFVFHVNYKRRNSHGYERHKVDCLGLLLLHVEKNRKNGNKYRSAAHSHASERAGGKPRQNQQNNSPHKGCSTP